MKIIRHDILEDYHDTVPVVFEETFDSKVNNTDTYCASDQDAIQLTMTTAKTTTASSGWTVGGNAGVEVTFNAMWKATGGINGSYNWGSQTGTLTQEAVSRILHRPTGAPNGWYYVAIMKIQPHHYGDGKYYNILGKIAFNILGIIVDRFPFDYWKWQEASLGPKVLPLSSGVVE